MELLLDAVMDNSLLRSNPKVGALECQGAYLWPAAEHLCTYIIANPSTFKGKRCLELGAGAGACSATLLAVGAEAMPSLLLCTDGEDDTVALMKLNCRYVSSASLSSSASLFASN